MTQSLYAKWLLESLNVENPLPEYLFLENNLHSWKAMTNKGICSCYFYILSDSEQ